MKGKWNSSVTIVICAIFITSCFDAPEEETAFSNKPASELPSSWSPSNLPIQVSVSTSYQSSSNSLFIQMADEWDTGNAEGIDFFTLPSSPNSGNISHESLASYLDSTMQMSIKTPWFEGVSSSALAVTTFFGTRAIVGGQEKVVITHMDIIENGDQPISDGGSTPGHYDRGSIMLHEMGHAIGLFHIVGSDAVMRPSLQPETEERQPYAADFAAVTQLYGDGSSSAILAGAEAASKQSSEVIMIVQELHTDGTCLHRIGDQVIHQHKTEIRKN